MYYNLALATTGLVWFGLWCLTALSTIFQLYRGRSVLLIEKTTTYRKSLINFIT
jgi:hypothetical protein